MPKHKRRKRKVKVDYFNLRFEYDDISDVITIEGVRYSGDLFRQFSPNGFETGTKFRFIRHDDNTFNVEKVTHEGPGGFHHVKTFDN